MSDAKGRKVDFRNSIILMTSNVGADVIGRSTALGFARHRDTAGNEQEAYDDMRDKVLAELKHVFRPEFMNRIDGVIVFHALSREHINDIVDLEIDKVCRRLHDHGLSLGLTDEAREYLGEKGYDPNLGARPLRRVIQMEIEDALSEGVLAERFSEGDFVTVGVEDGELAFGTEASQDATGVEKGEEPQPLETVLN